MNSYKITAHMDGSGLYYDPSEPIHLDSLIAWVLAPKQGLRHLDRAGEPGLVRLPVKSSVINGSRVWHASALHPAGPTGESIWYWRKRLRQSRCELTTGAPNLTNGTYRDWQMPVPLLLARRMVGYVVGKRKDIRKCLDEVRYLGKKRAHGHGKVLRWEIEECEDDHSLVMDGRAMRWLPTPGGAREVRPIPPYWHPSGRVACCEVGDDWDD